jgi:G3E family GTPase
MAKIDIVSGFLGAGKTTLIKKLLNEVFKGEQIVLIENEFGEIGIDGGFLKEAGVEITEMNSGCICCSLVGDFGKALGEVIEKFHPDRILIEPSGVGKLSDVIKAVEDIQKETEGIELDSFVTVADATKCKMYMKNFGEFFNNQIESANTIILSRTQNMSQDKLEAVVKLLKEHNEKAAMITTPWEELSGEQILTAMNNSKSLMDELMAEAQRLHEEHEKLHHHEHDHDHGEEGEEHHHHHDHGDEGEEHHHHHDHDEEGEEHHHHHDHDEEGHEHHHHDHDEEGHGHHHHDHDEEGHEHHHHDHDEEGHEHHHHDHDEEGHEHHHHDHDHEGHEHHYDENGMCSCGHHHDHHHADDVFTSLGVETPHKFVKDELEAALKELSESEEYGIILRAKGIVPSVEGKWLHFDLVPGEYEVRTGAADYTGRLCVIGTDLKENEIKELFHI